MTSVSARWWHGTRMMSIYWCFLSHLQSTLWVSNSILGYLLPCALHWAADTDSVSAQGLHVAPLCPPLGS